MEPVRRLPSTWVGEKQALAVSVAIFLVSGAGLAFEIVLTRIFSFLFHYHFAFLAISLAVLGISLGAALGRLTVPLRAQQDNKSILPITLAALCLGFCAVAVAIPWLPATPSPLPYVALALVPFALIGFFSATTFRCYVAYSGWLYGADLMGAAAGVALALSLFGSWGPFNVLLLLGLMSGLAGALTLCAGFAVKHSRLHQVTAVTTLLMSAGLLWLNLRTDQINLSPVRLARAPRDKTMMLLLNDPTQSVRVVHTVWDPFARVDLVETTDPATMFVFTDGGAGSFMVRFDGDLQKVAGLRQSLEFLPFELAPVDHVIILGAGAGKDVLLALLAGAERIAAVEVNPAMIQVARQFAAFNGHILDRPEVHLSVGDARAFMERDDQQYDLIYLNLVYTQATEPAYQALVENYIFTQEAFQAYLSHLTPRGHLAIVSHNALEGSRAAITGLQVLARGGKSLPQALQHLALLMYPASDPTMRTTVMVLGREPLRNDDVRLLATEAGRLGLQPLFLPGIFELPFVPLLQGATLEEFLAGDPTYDLSPTSDDRPYFFKLNPGLPLPIQQALGAAAFLAVAFLGLGLGTAGTAAKGWKRAGFVFYAALIGASFMLVEIPLIQRFHLLLGYPILSVAVVLSSLLLAGGIGSLWSQRWPEALLPRLVVLAVLWIAALAWIYRLLWPWLTPRLLPAPLAWRALATIVLTVLIGIPMGIPFPSLLRLSASDQQRLPLLWAVNGAFSVLGSTLAVVISMSLGFSRALATGAGLYLLLPLLFLGLKKQARGEEGRIHTQRAEGGSVWM